MSTTVALAGTTGRFRGLPRLLLERGQRVRVITRDPGSELAGELRGRGAQIVRGDFDEAAGLTDAIAGVDVLVAAGTAHRAGVAGEVRHGIAAADAARAAGVAHYVYLSGSGAGSATGVAVLDGKGAVEGHIRSLGLPHTIVAPVYFMENLFNPWNAAALRAGVYPSPISPERVLQQVAVEDVVAFLALVVERSPDLIGARIEIASDQSTGEQAARALSRAWARPLQARRVDPTALPEGIARLFERLETLGERVDIAALRGDYPQVPWHTLQSWAGTRGRQALSWQGSHA